MWLRDWDDLPDYMRTEEVKPYYEILSHKKGQFVLKRCFDVLCSIFLIFILSPLIAFFSIWIKIDSKGPIFYRQERVTQYGRIFRIFKLRTMVQNADQIGTSVTVKEDVRITKVGQKIRRYRIDEIPQLFNVLIGDMSFVGTRPEVKKYVDQYSKEMYATLLLPAGITSLASIEFKDEDALIENSKDIDKTYVSEILPKKMEFNLKEILKYTFIRDIYLMVKTIVKV